MPDGDGPWITVYVPTPDVPRLIVRFGSPGGGGTGRFQVRVSGADGALSDWISWEDQPRPPVDRDALAGWLREHTDGEEAVEQLVAAFVGRGVKQRE